MREPRLAVRMATARTRLAAVRIGELAAVRDYARFEEGMVKQFGN